MVSEERSRSAARKAAEARIRAQLIDGATLTLPVGKEFSYGFDPNTAVPIAGHGTAYATLTVTDEWGALKVVGGAGALLLRNERGVTGVVISRPADSATPLMGEGWTLTLKEGWSVRPSQKSGSFEVFKQ